MSEHGPNRSFVLRAVHETLFEERPVPELSDNDVLVEVKKTGICGSDVHYLTHGRIGDFVVTGPMVLGHESAGVVSKVGKGVTNVKSGDRVALEPGESCKSCDYCKTGRYELCAKMIFAATPPYDGTLARYYKLPADLVYHLPDNLSFEEGAMMEPLSVGVHSVHNIGQVKTNQNVVVFGAGPVGLLCMAVAKALGAKRVVAIDILQSRLDFAKQYAATDVFLPGKPNEGESKIDYSIRVTGEIQKQLGIEERGLNGVDVIIEASGAPTCIQMAAYLVKPGGTVVQVGMGSPEVEFPVTLFGVKQAQYKGSFRYGPGSYAFAIQLVASGKIDVKPLITHRFKFDDAPAAFEATRTGKGTDGKGVIKAIIDGPE